MTPIYRPPQTKIGRETTHVIAHEIVGSIQRGIGWDRAENHWVVFAGGKYLRYTQCTWAEEEDARGPFDLHQTVRETMHGNRGCAIERLSLSHVDAHEGK